MPTSTASSPAARLARRIDPALYATWIGLDLDPWQEQLLRTTRRQVIILCTRQAGKSTATAVKALHRAEHYPGSKIVIVAPAERQAGKLLETIKVLHGRQPQRTRARKWNVFSVQLANGSTIQAFPGKGDTIRGEDAIDLLIIEEAARIQEDLYTATRPMLAVSGGQIVLLSTPNGKRGTFYTTWRDSEDNPAWERIGPIVATEIPRITADFLADERRELPAALYQQEYECKFVEQLGAVFRQDQIQAAMNDPSVSPLFPTSRTEPLFDAGVTPLLGAR